jgi:hydrogenase nickel incorporation protein HypA/HybF
VHEFSIIQALIDQVEAELETAEQAGRVVSLDLTVGRLSGVHVDSLRFAFELLAPDTVVAGADLRVSQPQATVACLSCSCREETEEIVMRCPRCGAEQIRIEGGRELLLQSIELEESSPAASA